MICLLYVILNNYNVQNAAETNLGLVDTFLDKYKLKMDNFKNAWSTGSVTDIPSYIKWLRNVAIPSTFPQTHGGQPNLNSNLRVVGGARLRQIRVKKYSCLAEMISAGPRFSNKDGTCYGVYSAANEEKEPYGLNNSKKICLDFWILFDLWSLWLAARRKFKKLWHRRLCSTFNSSYTSNTAIAALDEMIEYGWFDSGTRILSYDFNLYNTAKQSLTSCSFMFEAYPSGYGNENYRIYTFDFAGNSDTKRILLYVESVVVALVVYSVISTSINIASAMRTWIVKGSAGPIFTLITSLAFWFDIFEILVYIVVGGLWISYNLDTDLNNFFIL
jgi:hypothetical protein